MFRKVVLVLAVFAVMGMASSAITVDTGKAVLPAPLTPETVEAETFDACIDAAVRPHDLYAKLKCAVEIAIAIWRNGEGSWTGVYDG